MAEEAKEYLNLCLKGRYLLEHHLGSGLSAHAFRAYDTLLQGRVVVKIIKDDIGGVPIELGDEWKAESRKAMQVRGHPHIASILDLGEETIQVGKTTEVVRFIVTEYVDGITLRDLEKSQSFIQPAHLLAIAHQLLSTLDYLQARKLSHDDLHSGNIMVSQLDPSKPFIRIIDFGMASNTIIPRTREKDVHFALSHLELLCSKALAGPCDALSRSVLENFAGLLKKSRSFIATGRMRIADVITSIEALQQELAIGSQARRNLSEEGNVQLRRIEVQRRTPFYGRKTELERLYRITQGSFLSKRGVIALISGEAGTGKTRLIDELLHRIAAEHVRHLLLYRKCAFETVNLPFATITGAIVDSLDTIEGKSEKQRLEALLGHDHRLINPLVQLVSEYRSMANSTGETGRGVDPATTPYLLLSFLLEAALSTPVIIYIDDLHLADVATIEFLDFMAQRIAESPIVVLSTYRPEDMCESRDSSGQSVHSVLADLLRKENVRHLELGGLDREEMDEILSNLYTFAKPSDFTRLSELVRQMAGGNPLYLFEITGLMEDEGHLRKRGDNHWELTSNLSNFAIPPSISNLLERRIERLSLNEILLLRTAAVQGQVFDIEILRGMFDPSGEKLEEVLERLSLRHGLIRPREAGHYVFPNHQLHQVMLRSIAPDDLVRAHRDVARLLEKYALQKNEPVPHHLVAHHLALGGEPRSAAEHYLAAGNRALAVQQYHLAIDHLHHAAEILSPEDSSELALNVTFALLEASRPLGERTIYEKAVSKLAELAEKLGRDDLKRRSMLEKCIFLRTISEHERSLALAEELISLARTHEDSAMEAAALKEAGTASYLMGRMAKAEEFLHLAAGILASTGDRSQLARVYNNLGLVCRNTQRHEEMLRYFQRALEIFREAGDTVGERFPLGNLGIVHLEKGEFERAFEYFSALKASLGNRTDLMIEAKVDYSIGEIFLEVGLYDEARELCEHSLATFLNIGNRQGESEVLGTLGGIHMAKGDMQLAKEYFERSIEVKREIGNIVGILHSLITLSRIANCEGRHKDALQQAEEVLVSARKRGLRHLELECLTEILHAKAQLEGPDEALSVLGPDENPENLQPAYSPALIAFAYKAGEVAMLAGEETRAHLYFTVAGRSVESVLDRIENPHWRQAYMKKRQQIMDAYQRAKSALPAMQQ